MKIFKTLILFLATLFVSTHSYEYILALERCPNSQVGDFTIHGLWPQYNSKSWHNIVISLRTSI